MVAQELCNKVIAGTLDNNFATNGLVSYYIKIGEQSLSFCSVRRSEEDPDGTVSENIRDAMHLAAGDLHAWIRAGRHDSCRPPRFVLSGVRIMISSEKIFTVDETVS
jgi:hypothetical protein